MTKNIIVIPDCCGSKDSLRKNIKYFYGKLVIIYFIEKISESNLFEKVFIIIYTEDGKYKMFRLEDYKIYSQELEEAYQNMGEFYWVILNEKLENIRFSKDNKFESNKSIKELFNIFKIVDNDYSEFFHIDSKYLIEIKKVY